MWIVRKRYPLKKNFEKIEYFSIVLEQSGLKYSSTKTKISQYLALVLS